MAAGKSDYAPIPCLQLWPICRAKLSGHRRAANAICRPRLGQHPTRV